MYSINWNHFIHDKTPSALRKPKVLAWLNALLTPLKVLHTQFLLWKTGAERDVAITPQVRILRFWLNELYDSTDRRFQVLDYVNTEPVLIWGESYNTPLYLPTFLSSRAYDFTVIAPCEAYSQRFFIIAFLDKYKLAGKQYKLKFETNTGDSCPLVGIPDWEDF
jgi:hypothetical protein